MARMSPTARLAESWRIRRSPPDPAAHQWVKAAALHKGESLRTPGSRATAYADGGRVAANPDGWMWDLTVPGNNDHDFYGVTGTTPVPVHNTSCRTFGHLSPSGRLDIPNISGAYNITMEDGTQYVGKAADIHERITVAFRAGSALSDLGYAPNQVAALDWMEMEGASDSDLFGMESQWIDYEGGIGNLANRINSPRVTKP